MPPYVFLKIDGDQISPDVTIPPLHAPNLGHSRSARRRRGSCPRDRRVEHSPFRPAQAQPEPRSASTLSIKRSLAQAQEMFLLRKLFQVL